MPALIIQMGHCYRRTGATGTDGEQDLATRVGDAAVRLLDGIGGWRVRKTLADVVDYHADAFVAVHADGSTNRAARGASVGYRTPEGQRFGQGWKRAYAARGWPVFRPDNYTAALAGYYGVREAVGAGTRRAIIIEAGFLTNSDDHALLTRTGGPERAALAIGDALGIPHGQTTPGDDMTPEEHQILTDGMYRLDALISGADEVPANPNVSKAVHRQPLHLVRLIKRMDAELEDLRGKSEDAATSAMLAADNAHKAAVAAVETSNKVGQLAIGGVDVQALASVLAPMVVDLMNRQARDNDSATGPTT